MKPQKSVCILRSNAVNPDSRVEKEAVTLHEAGYDVHVLAWDRDSDHAASEEILELYGHRIPITRLGYKATFGEGFKNIVPYLQFQLGMRRYLKKSRFDIIHACDFDTAFFSRSVVHGKKFVFDIFDFLYSDPKGLLQKCVYHAQNMLINSADATIICTEDRRRQIKGSRPRRLAVVHNTPMQPIGEVEALPNTAEDGGRVKVSYIGILQDYRLLKELASYFSKHPEYEWHVGGFGKYESFFKEYAEKYENIRFYGRIPYQQTLELERRCDINLAIYDPEIDNHKFAAPNKFYESLMLGKPVMMVRGTGMSEVVSAHGIGQVIEYSEEGFAEGMEKLVARRGEWEAISQKMKQIYRQEFSWEIMKERLLDLYAQL